MGKALFKHKISIKRYCGCVDIVKIYRKCVRVRYVWFDEEIEYSNTDVLRIRQRAKIDGNVNAELYHTLVLDLENYEEELWRKINKGVQYEVRRAGRENIRVLHDMQLDELYIKEFLKVYNRFSERKALVPINEEYIKKNISQDRLLLSISINDMNEVCSWHAYVKYGRRVRLLYSVTIESDDKRKINRAYIGRANRYHHWQDIIYFKNKGYYIYDFGGWYSGCVDQNKLKINSFKEGFGGAVEKSYNADIPVTFLGYLVVSIGRFITSIMPFE